jgi:pyrroloquinoline quinone biosynthesis protein B
MRMRALVLGSAAGGGLPQWNCGCSNCSAARTGRLTAQTQSSLAVTGDGTAWIVFNASPDIRAQFTDNSQLWPTDLRKSPLHSLILTNGDIDHIAGLLTLREKQQFTLYLTETLDEILTSNSVFQALDPALVSKRICKLDTWFEISASSRARLFPVPGKVPLFLEDNEVDTQMLGGQTVGIEFEANGARLLYVPGCAAVTPGIETKLDGADVLFFDGTLFQDDEMIAAGLGQKTGRRMGHISMSGKDGSLAALQKFDRLRKIYVHINNTNPVWVEDSQERRHVEAAGWEVGYDGMEITL